MAHIIKTQSSPYSAKQMFDLVADFQHYPNFLPFCTQANSKIVAENEVHGTLFIHKGPFRKSFTTHNKMFREANPLRIDITLVNGPFKQLEGEWRFEPTDSDSDSGCYVTLDLTYDMKSGFLNNALSNVFEWIGANMVESFCKEAHQVYAQ